MNKIKAFLKKWLFPEVNLDEVVTASEHIRQRFKFQFMLDSAEHEIKRLKHELMVTRVKLTKARNKIEELENTSVNRYFDERETNAKLKAENEELRKRLNNRRKMIMKAYRCNCSKTDQSNKIG